MTTTRPRATLAKVALLAHVSTATASNVLAGKGGASEQTAARIRSVAESIGYRAAPKARALSRGASTSIGIVVTAQADELIRDHGDLFWSVLMDRFVSECSRNHVVVSIVDESQGQTLVDSGVDALVILGPEADASITLNLPFGLPVLRSSGEPMEPGVLNYPVTKAAELIFAEFTSCGRSRVAWLVSSPTLNAVALWDAVHLMTAATELEFIPIEVTDRLNLVHALQDAGRLDGLVGAHPNPRELLDAIDAVGLRCPQSFSLIALSEGLLESMTSPSITTLTWCAEESGVLLANAAIAAAAGATVAALDAPIALVRRESTRT